LREYNNHIDDSNDDPDQRKIISSKELSEQHRVDML
jgi:hypothetical protein